MNKEYMNDPEYKKMVQAVLDANKIISRKKMISYLIYLVVMILLVVIAIFVVWNVLGLKDLFQVYDTILG